MAVLEQSALLPVCLLSGTLVAVILAGDPPWTTISPEDPMLDAPYLQVMPAQLYSSHSAVKICRVPLGAVVTETVPLHQEPVVAEVFAVHAPSPLVQDPIVTAVHWMFELPTIEPEKLEELQATVVRPDAIVEELPSEREPLIVPRYSLPKPPEQALPVPEEEHIRAAAEPGRARSSAAAKAAAQMTWTVRRCDLIAQ